MPDEIATTRKRNQMDVEAGERGVCVCVCAGGGGGVKRPRG